MSRFNSKSLVAGLTACAVISFAVAVFAAPPHPTAPQTGNRCSSG